MTRKEWRNARTAEGICLDCPNKVTAGCRRCATCLHGHRISRQEAILRDPNRETAEPEEHALDAKLSALGRCRCGLLNPCSDCVPDIYEYAGMRKSA